MGVARWWVWLPCLFLQGSAHTSIEPQHGINQVKHLADTGLILMAMDDPKLLAYYVPVSAIFPGIVAGRTL